MARGFEFLSIGVGRPQVVSCWVNALEGEVGWDGTDPTVLADIDIDRVYMARDTTLGARVSGGDTWVPVVRPVGANQSRAATASPLTMTKQHPQLADMFFVIPNQVNHPLAVSRCYASKVRTF